MPSTSLIDSHCHLDFDIFDDDRMEVLQRAKDNGISDIIIPGTERKYWERINQLCTKHSQLHACYGLHPYWVKNHDKKDVAALYNYINHNNVTALGECGLDFRAGQADKKKQPPPRPEYSPYILDNFMLDFIFGIRVSGMLNKI